MKYTVVTTFNQQGLEQYAQRMIDSFEQHWPADVDLIVCAEKCQPRSRRLNTQIISALDTSTDLVAFLQRHASNPLAHGLSGPPDVFNPKKQFRWNAVRFSHKVFALETARSRTASGWLIWIDADTHTHSPVTHEWLAMVCPADALASYLGRGERYHSECGWVAYNLDHPGTREFIGDFVDMYRTDSIFREREWHDSYIWDVVRRRYHFQHRFHNLNPDPDTKGLAGHPFINSALGLVMDHVKGERKQRGHSRAKEIVMHQHMPYWQGILAKEPRR